MCEAISDLFQGLFQRHERLDIAGKSMTIRYLFQHDSFVGIFAYYKVINTIIALLSCFKLYLCILL